LRNSIKKTVTKTYQRNKQTLSRFSIERAATKASQKVDKFIGIFSPKTAYKRQAFRFAYDAIKKSRLNKSRGTISDATEDALLSEFDLAEFRLIGRDMSRNNPIAVGMLETEADEIIGNVLKIKPDTGSESLDAEIEQAWKEEVLQSPVDVKGEWNFLQVLRQIFTAYRRDGDCGCIFTDDGLQIIEGEQIGTPIGKDEPLFKIINGVARKPNGKLLGYYVGKPTKYGYIEIGSYKKYDAKDMHLMYWPWRSSQSRGIPALTPSIKFMDNLYGYLEAELVAARVNACNCMFVARDGEGMPDGWTGGSSPEGVTDDGKRIEKMEPGTIIYGQPGETATGITQTRPGNMFDPYVNKMLSFIARPLSLPLMLVTLDFSGATYMNARIANQIAKENWIRQQEFIIKPFVRKFYKKWLAKKWPDAKTNNSILCRRWPYVDPVKEAAADKIELNDNKTTSPQEICARKGVDFEDVLKQRKEAGLDNDKDEAKNASK